MAWTRTQAFLAQWIGTWVYSTLCRSLRLTVSGHGPLEGLRRRYGAICFACWHSQFLIPIFYYRQSDMVLMVSEHSDGELIARVVQRVGYLCVRGSTTRGGIRALARLVKLARAGHDVAITPDGPRGPRYVVQPGIVYAARKTGNPIVPVCAASSRYWEFNSWDRFRVPKPWSRARVQFGEPIHVPENLSDDDIESWRLRVENGLKLVTRRAEEAVGLTPEETGS